MTVVEFNHYSVMLHETIEQLNINPDGIYVDGTLGGSMQPPEKRTFLRY